MLKVLIVAAIFSITFDMILADDSHRAYGKNFIRPCRYERTRSFLDE
jgi:hypothetical protein